MNDIRQSSNYAAFMEKLGWRVITVNSKQKADSIYCFVRKFTLIGSFIKILRPKKIPSSTEIDLLKKYRPLKIQIEPDISNNNKSVISINPENKKLGFRLTNEPLTPTKSILIDLRPKKDKIFSYFTPEKRRAVRRALKNNVTIEQSNNIEDFIKLKDKQLWPFGFLLQGETKKLWEAFRPKNKAILLLAYDSVSLRGGRFATDEAIFHNKEDRHVPLREARDDNILAGVLLLFHAKTSHYWLASSTKEGNKVYAPTLLVWDALKLSKKLGYKYFDFEGIEDERFPKTKSWRGFTKFKKGFGGKEIVYPQPVEKFQLPFLSFPRNRESI